MRTQQKDEQTDCVVLQVILHHILSGRCFNLLPLGLFPRPCYAFSKETTPGHPQTPCKLGMNTCKCNNFSARVIQFEAGDGREGERMTLNTVWIQSGVPLDRTLHLFGGFPRSRAPRQKCTLMLFSKPVQ